MAAHAEESPRDRFVTVYGFRPVLAALDDAALEVDKVLIAEGSRSPSVREIEAAARRRDVPVRRVPPMRVKVLAGNGKHDNGVLADVVAPRMRTLAAALEEPPYRRPGTVLVLDGVRTPANVGMLLRTATAAGVGGVVVPHRGTAGIDPLVVKASAGVAFHAPVLRSDTSLDAVERLVESGYAVLGLRGDADTSLFDAPLEAPLALVLGSETDGVTPAVAERLTGWLSIPMPGAVESLNVASAGAVVCFELVRRGLVH
ncbi:23S rRNA (guanosine2251-2'-O)-methyltransferase [Friedmanniella endophytica]|uniref:23S rRNA (Guanosine2251-2'-O)-methyltransferase n=1 Tax=Microlunatus kandeliicorticis TaxID=1759536 RepID=A0A7W3ITA6_9ACTN|nr:RNA methyltransferase [Microlunatus kandeliicorticis]MBA8794841.1 23S rRNA (guanosine2251-2'-O)-methyltransferase [Microlunatus kandeliicorticis]